jgi:hypothetical protein
VKGKVGEAVEETPADDDECGVSEEEIAEEAKEEEDKDEVSEEDKAEDVDEEVARSSFTTCTSWFLSLGYSSDDGSSPSKSMAS